MTHRPFLPVAALLAAGCATVPPSAPPPAAGTAALVFDEATIRRTPLTGADIKGFSEEALFKLLAAEIAGQRGQVDLALQNYIEIAQATEDPQIAERATRIAVFARDNARALAAAERWAALQPASVEAHQIVAAMKIRTGDVEGALGHLEQVLASDGAAAGQKLRMIANFLGREQDKAAALEVMRRLVEKRSDDPDALLAYALLAIRTDNVAEARTAMDRLAAGGPVNPGLAIAYIGLLQRHEDLPGALAWMEAALARDSGNFDLRLVYARLLADARRYDDARVQFEQLATLNPEHGDVQYALGLLYLQANRLDDAAKRFSDLYARNQRVEETAYYLGQIAEARRDAAGALDWYRKLDSGPNHFDAQLRIALLLARSGDLPGARAQLQGLTPTDEAESARRTRVEGEILTEHGRLDEAMAVYDRALEAGYDGDIMYTRAMLAERMDRIDVVERDLRTVLEHDPDNAQALNALGYTLADRTDRYAEAYELIARALQLSPQDYYILDSMGWVLYRLGRLDEAVDYLQRARAIRDDAEVAAHLAEVLWVKGDREAAREVWEAALKSTPDDATLLETIKRLQP